MKRNNNEMDENCIRIESYVDWTQDSQSNVEKSIELNLSSTLINEIEHRIDFENNQIRLRKIEPNLWYEFNTKQCLLIYARLYIVYEVILMLIYSLINQIHEKCF